MNVGVRYFLDVPVYRLPEDEYYAARDEYVDKALFPPGSREEEWLRERDRRNPRENDALRSSFAKSYGGPWRYNEIIGHIRLHFLGSQIRGEWHAVRKSRIVRTRSKVLENLHWKLAPEVGIPNGATSEQIFQLVLKYMDKCRKELKRRYVDTTVLEALGPHIDWRSLYDAQPPVAADAPQAARR